MNLSGLSNNSFVPLQPHKQNITRCTHMLQEGRIVAFPTETVYGLGGDAANDAAIQAIYDTKGRPAHNPLILHIGDADMVGRYSVPFAPELVAKLAGQFWPGALTLVLPVKPGAVSPLALAGGQTVGLRMPSHPVARAMLRRFGKAVAAPSANRSGQISPTTAEHVTQAFRDHPGALAAVLDGGPTPVGVESTVLDISSEMPRLLRAGSVTVEAIEAVLGQPLAGAEIAPQDVLTSPGLLQSHYAPRARVRLNVVEPEPDEALLAFGPDVPAHRGPVYHLSVDGSLEEAAHRLYAGMRALDASGAACIAVMPIPATGIGLAIHDRLQRAAAPRLGDDDE